MYLSTTAILFLLLLVWSWSNRQEDQEEETRALRRQLTALQQTLTPPQSPHAPLPRIDFTSHEDYVAYRQAHGLPYTPQAAGWPDGWITEPAEAHGA